MFAGIASLIVEESNITGMASREGEIVHFNDPIIIDDKKRVDAWLTEVESSMRAALVSSLSKRMEENTTNGVEFLKLIESYPAQINVLSSQVMWCQDVEKALVAGPDAVFAVISGLRDKLGELAGYIATDVSPQTRKKVEQLITELVHQRDVTERLHSAGIISPSSFEWLQTLRHAWSAKDNSLYVKMANATFKYGFEYLGIGEKLVQTPLTDRCYLTLTQALHLRLGGNPFGPAGTGKTESVKALGAQARRFVLVFNCDENFDLQAMGRIFVGLCQVGAWGCFDEFNRLEEKILSAVSQQILHIQKGLLTKTHNVNIIGRSVSLNPDVGIFVTMNPGYAGRSNLPDNLKQLFRSIAMIRADREVITEVMLFSQGFATARKLAGKVVLLFKLMQRSAVKAASLRFWSSCHKNCAGKRRKSAGASRWRIRRRGVQTAHSECLRNACSKAYCF